MKTKLIIRLVLLQLLVGSVTSCDNFLDTRVDTDLTPGAVGTNRAMLWAFGNAFYTPITSGFSALDNNLFAAASDEAQRTQESGNAYIFNKGTLSPDNVSSATSAYVNCYEGIRAANFFLDFAKNGEELLALNRDIVTDKVNYEKDLRNLAWYRAEAHVARAYYYMELIKRFGGVPVVEKVIAQGQRPEMVRQSSYEEVVEYIVREIDENLESLQTNWKTHPDGVATNDGRFDRKSALAIKARTLLYAASPLRNAGNDIGKWERAARAAHDLIKEMNYTMPMDRDYGRYFVGNNATQSDESIFLIRKAADNSLEVSNYPIGTPGGQSGVTPTQNLVDAYEYVGDKDPKDPYTNRDPRLQATIVVNGSKWNGRVIDGASGGTDDMGLINTSKTGYYLKKFLKDELNLIQNATEVHVWVVFRYAEVLLNYAEAMNRAYGPDGLGDGLTLSARSALMQVRRSASSKLPAVTTTNKDDFEEAVRRERQVELAFEDHRYWDLLRWNLAFKILNQSVRGVAISRSIDGTYSYNVVDVAERKFYSHNYYMPFPRSEVANSQGTLSQNAGY